MKLIHAILIIGGVLLAATIAHRVIFAFIARARQTTALHFNWGALHHLRRPVLYLLLLSVLQTLLPLVPLRANYLLTAQHVILLVLIALIGYTISSSLQVARDLILHRIDQKSADSVQARRLRTQLVLINRVLIGVLVLLVVAAMLMTFESVRTIGAGLFASAGIAGIIVGTAANGVLKNLLAGLQIAITQPIRLDDVVIVEGEWGRIEEIGSAFVIVKIWDLRRLVVPLNYFIEKPFQSWTRNSSELLGTAFLYVDYSVPVSALREHFLSLLESQPLWDRKVAALQVTDTNAQSIEIRCLVSAADAPRLFDLRCIVREHMLRFVADHYPQSLPQTRTTLGGLPGGE